MPHIISSTKADGDMVFKSGYPELNDQIRLNRIQFFKKNSIDPARVVNLEGIHKTHVEIVEEKDLGKGVLDSETRIKNADGLITNTPNSCLMITGADCF